MRTDTQPRIERRRFLWILKILLCNQNTNNKQNEIDGQRILKFLPTKIQYSAHPQTYFWLSSSNGIEDQIWRAIYLAVVYAIGTKKHTHLHQKKRQNKINFVHIGG